MRVLAVGEVGHLAERDASAGPGTARCRRTSSRSSPRRPRSSRRPRGRAAAACRSSYRPCSRSSASTSSYCSGLETTATWAKFFAAARSIDGPPTSIISTTSASVAAALGRDRCEGIEVDADEIDRRDVVLGERVDVLGKVAPREDSRMDARVQRLDAAAEHLRRLRSRPRRSSPSSPCSSRYDAVPPDETSSQPSSRARARTRRLLPCRRR